MTGVLITLSGIDGSGKSTVARRLHDAVAAAGRSVRVVRPMRRDPGFIGAVASMEPPSQVDADEWTTGREEFVAAYISWTLAVNAIEIIRPALAAGEVVICDRWVADHVVSQTWFGVDVGSHAPVLATLPDPDVAFLVDCDPELAQRRIDARGDAGAGTGHEFLHHFRTGLADWFTGRPHVRLDGGQAEQEVFRLALRSIEVAL